MQGMKRGKAANIWDVVSSLAQALTDARDQLLGLINFDGSAKGCNNNRRWHGKESTRRSNVDPEGNVGVHQTNNALAMRLRGGGVCGKCHVPNNDKVRSVHHQRATRGHVAFGINNHSESKPEPPCKLLGKPPETMALSCCPSRAASRPGSGKGRGVQLYLDAKSNSLQINSQKGGCDTPVSIFIPKSPCASEYSCRSPCRKQCRPPSPYGCRRHCIGTQYAALLREEACRSRERRLAKNCERMNAKPRWAHWQ